MMMMNILPIHHRTLFHNDSCNCNCFLLVWQWYNKHLNRRKRPKTISRRLSAGRVKNTVRVLDRSGDSKLICSVNMLARFA